MKVLYLRNLGTRRAGKYYECRPSEYQALLSIGYVKKQGKDTVSAPVNTEIQPEAADIAGIEETSAAEPADQDAIDEPGDEQPVGVEETSAVRKSRRKRNTEPQE